MLFMLRCKFTLEPSRSPDRAVSCEAAEIRPLLILFIWACFQRYLPAKTYMFPS